MRLLFHGIGHYELDSPGIGPACWEDWPDIIFCWKGEVAFESTGGLYTMREGDALLIPPGNRFEGRAVSPVTAIWVMHFLGYEPSRGDSPFAQAKIPCLIPQACRTRVDRLLLEELNTGWHRSPNPREERSLALLGELILARVEERPPAGQAPARFRAAVEAALARPPAVTRVGELARRVGSSPSYFRERFREHYGVPPQEFLLRTRMEEARRLLRETVLPIKEVSDVTGFGAVAAFHRAFVREVRLTPAAYRRRYGRVT